MQSIWCPIIIVTFSVWNVYAVVTVMGQKWKVYRQVLTWERKREERKKEWMNEEERKKRNWYGTTQTHNNCIGLYNMHRTIKANHPDIVIKTHKNRMCFLIRMAVTTSYNGNFLSIVYMWHKAKNMGHPVRIELTTQL